MGKKKKYGQNTQQHKILVSLAHSHLVEQKDEIDCKGDKKSQQAQIIKVPCKIVLEKRNRKKSEVCGLYIYVTVEENWHGCKDASLSTLYSYIHSHVCLCVCILPAGSCYECQLSPKGQIVGSVVLLTYLRISWLSLLPLLSHFQFSSQTSFCK